MYRNYGLYLFAAFIFFSGCSSTTEITRPQQVAKVVKPRIRHEVTTRGVSVRIDKCQRINRSDVTCNFTLNSEGRDRSVFIYSKNGVIGRGRQVLTLIYDDLGTEYKLDEVSIADQNMDSRLGPVKTLIADTKVNGILGIKNVHTKATQIKKIILSFRVDLKGAERHYADLVFENYPISMPVAVAPSLSAQPETKPTSVSPGVCCDLNGEFRYLGRGLAQVKQNGNEVHMFLTWAPAGKGPHYEVKAKLTGNILEGEWFSFHHSKGWFYFMGEVSPSGKMIDLSKSEDPIGSNIKRVRLMKN